MLIKTLSLNLNRELFKISICSLIDYSDKGDKEPLPEEIAVGGVDVATFHMKGSERQERKEKILKEDRYCLLTSLSYGFMDQPSEKSCKRKSSK